MSVSSKLPTPADKNQSAYWELQSHLDASYEKGRFVAIVDGKVFVDAPSFQEIREILRARLGTPHEALVVQAGVHYPRHGAILT